MTAVHQELAGIEAQIEAVNKAMLKAAQTPMGTGLNTQFLSKYADEVHNVRKDMLSAISAQGDFGVQSMKVASQADILTEKIQRQKFGIRDLVAEHKNLGEVYKQQMSLQKSMVMQWGRNANGSINADLITPRSLDETSKAYTSLANRAGFYNQVLASVSDQTVKWGKNTQWAGRQLTAGISMPILAAAAGMGMLAYQVDKGLTQVVKVYGDSTTQFEGMTNQIREETMSTAKQLASTYGQSVKDSIEITSQLAATGKTGVQLQEATTQVTRARTLGELNLQDAMSATITLQSVYQMNSEKLGETFNFMNAMENQTSLTMQDFVVGIPKAVGVLKEFGGTVQDAGILLAGLKAGGIDAAEGANAIKSIAFKIINPNKPSKDLFEQMTGASFDETMKGTNGVVERLVRLSQVMKGLSDTQRIGLIQKMFGLYQGSKALTLLDQLTSKSDQMTKAYQVANQSSAQWAATAQGELTKLQASASKRLQMAWESLKANLAEFGQVFLNMATPVLGAIDKIVQAFNGMTSGQKKFAAFAMAAVASLGPLIMLAGLVGNLIGNIGKFSTAMVGLGLRFRILDSQQMISQRLAKSDAGLRMNEAEAYTVLSQRIKEATSALAQFNNDQIAAQFKGAQNYSQKVFQSSTGTPVVATANGRVRPAGKNEVAAQLEADRAAAYTANAALPVGAKATSEIAAESERANKSWRGISASSKMYAAAGVAGMTSMIAPTGSVLSNVSNAVLIGGTLLPLLGKIGFVSKAVETVGFNAKVAANLIGRGGIGSAVSKVIPGAGMLASRFAAFLPALGPVGLAVAAIGAAVGSVYYVLNKNIQQSRKEADAFNNDAQAWAKTIGFTYTEAGSRVTSAGDKIVSLTDKVAAFKEAAGDGAKEFEKMANTLNEKQKIEAALDEGRKAVLHGASPAQAEEAVKVALGVLRAQMASLPDDLLTLKIHGLFDFGNADLIANTQMTKMSDAMQRAAQGKFDQGRSESIARWFTGNDDLNGPAASAIQSAARDMWNTFSNASQKQQSKVFDDIANSVMKAQDDLFNTLQSKHGDAFAKAGITNADQLASFAKVNRGRLGQVQGGMGLSDDEVNNLLRTMDAVGTAIDAFGGKAGIAGDKLHSMVDFRQMKPFIGGMKDSVEAAKMVTDASKQYDKWLADSAKANIKLTDAEKLKRLNLLRTSVGLAEVTDLHKAFTDVVDQNTGAIKSNADQMASWENVAAAMKAPTGMGDGGAVVGFADASTLMDAYKSAYSGAMDDIYSSAQSIMDKQAQAASDAVKNNFDAQGEALQAQADKAKAQAEATKKAVSDSYDARIQKIKDSMKAEQDAENLRQKIFEAEKTRISRMADMYNRNIDIQQAIVTGKLDTAAKLGNDATATQAGWNADDASKASQSASDAKIAAQQATMDHLDKEKQARLDALDAANKAEQDSYDKKKKLLDKQQKNAEAAIKAETDANTRGLQARLAVLKAFVPRNEAEMAAHIKKIEAAYAAYGVNLSTKGSGWGNVVGTALQNAVSVATVNMSNNIAWGALGKVAAEEMAKGAFNMTLAQFMSWVTTGSLPAGWAPSTNVPGTKVVKGPNGTQRWIMSPSSNGGGKNTAGGMTAYHTGGVIGKSGGGRTGFAGNSLSQSEVMINALKGEAVLNRKATGMLGEDFVDLANRGLLPKNIGGPDLAMGMGGMFSAIMGGVMRKSMQSAILSAGMAKQGIEAGAAGFNYAATNKGAGKYGGTVLSAEQLNNAGIIASTGKSLGASNRDIMIALMTALQESSLRNLNYGDRDSLGLFQQRSAWGSAAERTNAAAATRMFFNGGHHGQRGLFGVADRGKMTLGEAAQAVQVSAFPGAYEQWSDEASAILSSLSFTSAGGALNVTPQGWVRPAVGPRTSPFGMRVNPVTGIRTLHAGSDIGAGMGSAIFAARAGTVVSTADAAHSGGYGNYTIIDHGNGIRTAYAHQSRFNVKPGQHVSAGQNIGNVGSTGNSTGPHLHFEYIKNGVRTNPGEIIPGLKTGGFAMSDGLANLHKGEAVIPARLTEAFKNNVANSNSYGYNVRMDFNGAHFDSQIDFEEGVKNALLAIEKQRGTNRRVG